MTHRCIYLLQRAAIEFPQRSRGLEDKLLQKSYEGRAMQGKCLRDGALPRRTVRLAASAHVVKQRSRRAVKDEEGVDAAGHENGDVGHGKGGGTQRRWGARLLLLLLGRGREAARVNGRFLFTSRGVRLFFEEGHRHRSLEREAEQEERGGGGGWRT